MVELVTLLGLLSFFDIKPQGSMVGVQCLGSARGQDLEHLKIFSFFSLME